MRNKTLEENFNKFCNENKIEFATATFILPDSNILVCGKNVYHHPLTNAIINLNSEFIKDIIGEPKFSIIKNHENNGL